MEIATFKGKIPFRKDSQLCVSDVFQGNQTAHNRNIDERDTSWFQMVIYILKLWLTESRFETN